jgi:hypothetical protein
MLGGSVFPGYRALPNFLWRRGYTKWTLRYKKNPGRGTGVGCLHAH